MNILIISASPRAQSQSLKVAQWLERELKDQKVTSSVLDLHALQLPMYDDGETQVPQREELVSTILAADGYVFVSPEWNGSMSVALLNMLHYVGLEMAHKPVMLVGVSSGRGGAYPITQMRLAGHKNRHYVLSPESLIASGVEGVFTDHTYSENEADYPLKQRAKYGLKVLLAYAVALRQVRSELQNDLETFKNGV